MCRKSITWSSIWSFLWSLLKFMINGRTKGQPLSEESLFKGGYRYKCTHKTCGGLAYYIRPYYDNNESMSAVYKTDDGLLHPQMTARRCMPDGYVPLDKSCHCWTCDKVIDYVKDSDNVICEPLKRAEENKDDTAKKECEQDRTSTTSS